MRLNDRTLVAYRAISDVAAKGAFFLLTLFAARRLSREAFGLFALGTTLGWVAAVASDFGIQLHVARAVAQRPAAAADLLRAWARVRLSTAVAVLTLALVCTAVIRPAAPTAVAILLFTLVYVVNGVVEFLNYVYRGLGRSDLESTLAIAERGAVLVLGAAVLWVHPTLPWLAGAMLVPAAATLAYSMRQARTLAASTSRDGVGSRAPLAVAMQLRRDVFPIGAGIVLSALYFRVDVFLVEMWRGTQAVGTYNAMFRVVDALRLAPAAVLAVALPLLCRADTMRPLRRIAAAVSALAAGATAVLWWEAGDIVPLLYGAGYADGVPIFRILVLSFPLMSLNYTLTHQLIAWHGHREYALVCAAAFATNLAVNSRAIRSAGLAGAAWATFATEMVVTVGCLGALAAVGRTWRRGHVESGRPSYAGATRERVLDGVL